MTLYHSTATAFVLRNGNKYFVGAKTKNKKQNKRQKKQTKTKKVGTDIQRDAAC